jgi:hypothetical protein
MSSLPADARDELARPGRNALLVGVAAAVVCAAGAFIDPGQFFRAYLSAYVFWLGLPLGCLAILMLYHLTGGAWGFLARRTLEAASRTIPLTAILFLPMAGGMQYLYVWARPGEAASNPAVKNKVIYLNAPFFWARAALFFVIWAALAYTLSHWSRKQDETGDPRLPDRLGWLSGVGLAVYGVTVTFASVDWVMSLMPAYRSTIFGPVFASSQLVSGLAFALLVLAWLVTRPPLAAAYSEGAFIDLGNLLFTFVIIWAYLNYFQFMLIWIANLRYDAIWFLARTGAGWKWVAWALFLFGFAVPFLLLLTRDVKRSPRGLAKVAALLLFMQLVFDYYQVLPCFAGTRVAEHWLDFVTPFAVGGLWLANFIRELGRAPLLPRQDVSQVSAEELRHHDQEQAERREAIRHG